MNCLPRFLLLLLASLCAFDLSWCSSLSAVEDAYRDVISIVSPGEENLTQNAVHSLFDILENRVQCGAEVPCEKVSFIRPPTQRSEGRPRQAGALERSRSKGYRCAAASSVEILQWNFFLLFYLISCNI